MTSVCSKAMVPLTLSFLWLMCHKTLPLLFVLRRRFCYCHVSDFFDEWNHRNLSQRSVLWRGSVVFISLMNESQKSFKLASVCSKAIVLGFFTSLTSLMKGITEICGYCLFLGNGLPISISLINGSTDIYS